MSLNSHWISISKWDTRAESIHWLSSGLDLGVWFTAGAGNFSLQKNIHTGSEAHPAFYPKDSRDYFPEYHAAGIWITCQLRLLSQNRIHTCGYTSAPSYDLIICTGAILLYFSYSKQKSKFMKVSAHKIKKWCCFASVQIFNQALRNSLSWEFHISELGMTLS